MSVYWEQNVGGVYGNFFDTKEEDEDREIQKPQIHNIEDEQHMKDPMVNIVLILELYITNKFG